MSWLTHYHYWIIIALMMCGLYMAIAQGHLVRKLIGVGLFQTSVFFLYISFGFVDGGQVPILTEGATRYSNPLPHVLILTAIVVGVATMALGLALVARIKEEFGTVEEEELEVLDRDEHPADDSHQDAPRG